MSDNDRDLSCFRPYPKENPVPERQFNLTKLRDLERQGAHVLVVMPPFQSPAHGGLVTQYDIFDLSDRSDDEPLRYSITQATDPDFAEKYGAEHLASYTAHQRAALTTQFGQAVFTGIWWPNVRKESTPENPRHE